VSVSGQCGWYQNVSVPPVAGTAIVCDMVLSPLVGEVEPSSAAYVPVWLVVLIVSDAPLVVQPLKLPVSNPPLVTTEPPPPAGFTVSDTVVECVALVPVPVTVIVEVPAGVEADVLIVSVEVPPAVTDAGLKLAVAPEGSPLALKDTDWADPLVTAVEIVDVADAPCVADTLDGLAEIEKSLVAVPPQPGNLNATIRVCQLNAPLLGSYSFTYQNVQSSAGSTVISV
jgi:hypothetical protein